MADAAYFESWARRWRGAADVIARHGGDVEAAMVEHALELAVLMSFFPDGQRQAAADSVMTQVFSNLDPLHGAYDQMRASMAEAGALDLSDEN